MWYLTPPSPISASPTNVPNEPTFYLKTDTQGWCEKCFVEFCNKVSEKAAGCAKLVFWSSCSTNHFHLTVLCNTGWSLIRAGSFSNERFSNQNELWRPNSNLHKNMSYKTYFSHAQLYDLGFVKWIQNMSRLILKFSSDTSLRDGSKFIRYPGRDHRQGGEDFFSKKN